MNKFKKKMKLIEKLWKEKMSTKMFEQMFLKKSLVNTSVLVKSRRTFRRMK